jgi:hypothetical protein
LYIFNEVDRRRTISEFGYLNTSRQDYEHLVKNFIKIPKTTYYLNMYDVSITELLTVAGIKYYDYDDPTYFMKSDGAVEMKNNPTLNSKVKKYGSYPYRVYYDKYGYNFKYLFESEILKLALKEVSKYIIDNKIKIVGTKTYKTRASKRLS